MAIDGIMLEAGLANAALVPGALLVWLMGRGVTELRIFRFRDRRDEWRKGACPLLSPVELAMDCLLFAAE
jgi:hypothetical protein